MPLKDLKIGFIGSGAMGSAISLGLLKSGVSPSRVFMYDLNLETTKALQEKYQISVAKDIPFLVSEVDLVLLAVKPQIVEEALKETWGAWQEGQTLVSIAAGVATSKLEELLKDDKVAVIRAMPNCSALIGESATAVCIGKYAKEKDLKRALAIFKAIGEVIEVFEKDMDAVTGLSGSGPAYLFLIIEAMANAGVKLGLTKDKALLLAAQTVKGAASMVLEGEHPAKLKEMVTTPSGTTIEGLYVLEKCGLRGSLMEAVEAATKRSANLG